MIDTGRFFRNIIAGSRIVREVVMKVGFSETSPFPQPKGEQIYPQRLHGLKEEVQYLPGTAIRVWYTHQGTCYPKHWHDCLEIIQCVHSQYTIHTEHKTYTVQPEDILVLPAGALHDLNPGSDCNGWVYLIGLQWLEHIPPCREIRFQPRQPILISRQRMPALYTKVSSLLELMRNDYFSDNVMREVLFDSSVLRLVELIFAQRETHFKETAQLDKRHEHDEMFEQVVSYIDSHFAEDLTLTSLSRRYNLSSAYFSRLFKQYTHDSFSNYLTVRRFLEADRLLMNSSLPITEVATRCGYSNPAVFSRAYYAHRKCSPSRFRQIYARLEGEK